MRAVVQRVIEASVVVEGRQHSAISAGLLVYLGIDRNDGDSDVQYLADKLRHIRIFPDDSEKLNLNVVQAGGGILVVSAFTVQGDARRGRRPSFENAANLDRALVVYELFCDALRSKGVTVQRGCFGKLMGVRSVNDGPVCILLDSRRNF